MNNIQNTRVSENMKAENRLAIRSHPNQGRSHPLRPELGVKSLFRVRPIGKGWTWGQTLNSIGHTPIYGLHMVLKAVYLLGGDVVRPISNHYTDQRINSRYILYNNVTKSGPTTSNPSLNINHKHKYTHD